MIDWTVVSSVATTVVAVCKSLRYQRCDMCGSCERHNENGDDDDYAAAEQVILISTYKGLLKICHLHKPRSIRTPSFEHPGNKT